MLTDHGRKKNISELEDHKQQTGEAEIHYPIMPGGPLIARHWLGRQTIQEQHTEL